MATSRADDTGFPFSFTLECVVVAAIAGAWIGWIHIHPDQEAKEVVSNAGLMSIAFAAAIRCRYKATRADGRVRRAWTLFGAAALSWGLGQAAWFWYEGVRGEKVPFPSEADIGYLGLVPLIVAGLLSLPSTTQRLSSRARTVLDGLIIASSLLLISWATVLEGVYRSDDGLLSKVVGLAYPLGDVVIITTLLMGLVRTRRLHLMPRLTLLLLSLGLVAFSVADSGFAYQTGAGTYASGNLIDAGWFLGFSLIYLAASRPPRWYDAPPEPVERRSEVLVPYVAVVLAVLTGMAKLVVDGRLGVPIGWTALALTSLIVLRQVVTLVENVSLTRDLEARVRARTEDLHRSEARFRSLVQHSSDVTTLVDAGGTVAYQSSSGARVFDFDPAGLIGRSLLDVVHPDDRDTVAAVLRETAAEPGASTVVEFPVSTRDGGWRQTESTITNMLDNPSVGGLVLNTRDISERRRLQDELVHSAFHDSLTQLANRRLFQRRLQEAVGRVHVEPSDQPHQVAVLFLDLDDFKAINDSYGHATGDLVLIEVGERLLQCVRITDTVARLGGDEFAVLLERVTGPDEVNAVAQRISEALRSPFRVEQRELFVAGSVGIAATTGRGESAEDLLRNADLAMYEAKGEHVGSYRWFEPAMHRLVLRRLEIDGDLRRAVERSELFLEYQPIVDLCTGTITGAEALVRWTHPTRGTVGPAEFIPLAERNGLVAPIGEWVIEQACRQLRDWQDAHDGCPLTMSVNLSARQLDRCGTADLVADVLERCGLAAQQLVLEMTETSFIPRTELALGTLEALKELGVRLAVDDFGTGYSALSYLHHLPVDVIKIDKLFVDRLTERPDEAGLAASIVRIGQDLRLTTVAEGVEHHFQLDVLRSIGCNLGQGFLMARPVSAADFTALLQGGGGVVASSGG